MGEKSQSDAVVVGAGLAGAASAIVLAHAGFDVVLVERRTHPFHKLCGEFLSSESIPLLTELGIDEKVRSVGVAEIDTVRLTAPGSRECAAALPEPALGVSRYELDRALIDRAVAVGVRVLEPWQAHDIRGDFGSRFSIELSEGTTATTQERGDTISTRLAIGAWGRRSRLDRTLRPDVLKTTPWVAFKGHYRGCDVGRTIELHAFRDGYCGLSHVEDGLLNACWIMHSDRLPQPAGDLHAAIVASVFSENELLRERFEQMTLQWEKPLSVSQLGFRATAPFVGDIALAGDAAGMIAPLCGDGMSMALMSGIFLGRLAAEYLDGRLSSDDFRAVYTRAWESGFGRRMFLGRLTHRLLTNPTSARIAVGVGRRAPSTLDWLTRQTRGYPAAFVTRR